jgi:hypothetical protein
VTVVPLSSTPHVVVFDRVEVTEGGRARDYTPSEFLALPLAYRIGSVLQGKCRFFRGDEPVERNVALNELRRMAGGR